MSSSEHSKRESIRNDASPVRQAKLDASAHYSRVIAETQNTVVVPRRDVKKRRISGMPKWAGKGAL